MADLFENLVNVALNDLEGLGQTLYPIIEAGTAHRRVASATANRKTRNTARNSSLMWTGAPRSSVI